MTIWIVCIEQEIDDGYYTTGVNPDSIVAFSSEEKALEYVKNHSRLHWDFIIVKTDTDQPENISNLCVCQKVDGELFV